MPSVSPANPEAIFKFATNNPPLNTDHGQVNLYVPKQVYVESFSATLAEINAGADKILVPPGYVLVPVDFNCTSSGVFAAGTSVNIVLSDGTALFDILLAGINADKETTGPSSTDVVIQAGFNNIAPALAQAGKALRVQKTGSNFTGGTSLRFTISYRLHYVGN